MKRHTRPNAGASLVWACARCCQQMYGGPRCYAHNPTPEQRAMDPVAYRREQYAPSIKQVLR